MTLKKILCIGTLMALPMSMSASDSEKISVEKFFHSEVQELQTKGTSHLCEYKYILQSEELVKLLPQAEFKKKLKNITNFFRKILYAQWRFRFGQ